MGASAISHGSGQLRQINNRSTSQVPLSKSSQNSLYSLSKQHSFSRKHSFSRNNNSSSNFSISSIFNKLAGIFNMKLSNDKLNMSANSSVTDFSMPSATSQQVIESQSTKPQLVRADSTPANMGSLHQHNQSYSSIMQGYQSNKSQRRFTIDSGSVYANTAEEAKHKLSYSKKDWGDFFKDIGEKPDYQPKHSVDADKNKARPVSPNADPYAKNVDDLAHKVGSNLDNLDEHFGLYTGVAKSK